MMQTSSDAVNILLRLWFLLSHAKILYYKEMVLNPSVLSD